MAHQADTNSRPASPLPLGGDGANLGEAGPSLSDEPYLKWPVTATARCFRSGLTERQILVMQVLTDLPHDDDNVCWISAAKLAEYLYGEVDENKVRLAMKMLATLVRKGFILEVSKSLRGKAKRYDLTPFFATLKLFDCQNPFAKKGN